MKKPLIFGIGMTKTGVTSLGTALRLLGIPCMHNSKRMKQALWGNRRTGRRCLEPLPQQFRAFCDSPIPHNFEQVDEDYPGSLFIATVRDLEPWLRSRQRWFGTERARNLTARREWYDRLQRHFGDRCDEILFFNLCGGDGWEPLCEFLGVPVPDLPFPHKNVTTVGRARRRRRKRRRK